MNRFMVRVVWRGYCTSTPHIPIRNVTTHIWSVIPQSSSSRIWTASRYYGKNNRSNKSDVKHNGDIWHGEIPRDKVKISFARSSGAGGQNVNKVSTKVEIRFHLDSASWLPAHVRERLRELNPGRVTKGGEIVLTSQKTRSQLQNINDAFERLEEMCTVAAKPPTEASQEKKERIVNLKNQANEKRKKEKQKLSDKKKISEGVSF
eukprot:m.39219 g.39219  ORF g.39219 m.39219 type:complete len:205 (+) comp9521_c1_seq1:154-768(+)